MEDRMVQIDANLQWRVFRDDGAGRWVGVCDALGFTAEAESWERLSSAVSEMLDLLMDDLLETGEFDAFLREQAWRVLGDASPISDHCKFDVPFSLIRDVAPISAGPH